MTLEEDLTLSWTPSRGQAGVHEVIIRVTDGHGGEAVQDFAIINLNSIIGHKNLKM